MSERPDRATPRASARGVAELVRDIANSLAQRFGAVSVRGEIGGFTRASSGHCYFTLKDADGEAASLRCAMFRRAAGLLDFAAGDGQLVEVRGRVAVYEPRGELQFVVEAMRRAGDGALYEQFLRLKARLEAQGLFDPSAKRAIPAFARRIGVVTSLGGAALHDVLSTLARRSPHVGVTVYPSLVQGVDAPAALCAAIELACRRGEVDTLIVCRGGGSLEDLWAFNDERVVRAIRAATLPVICGVGHETDLSLADLAADLRAPTPTAAAELAAPPTQDCLRRLAHAAQALRRQVRRRLDSHAQALDRAALQLLRPDQGLQRQARRLDQLGTRLTGAMRRPLDRAGDALPRLRERLLRAAAQTLPLQRSALDALAVRLQRAAAQDLPRRRERLQALGARLDALAPTQVLRRGYAWISDGQGRPMASVRRMHVGDALRAVLADGSAAVTVTALAPDHSAAPGEED